MYLEDTDAQGVVYNASYFRFLERARTDWLRECGIDHSDLGERLGIVLVLTAISAKFRAPARLGDMLSVTAALADVRGARVLFEQQVCVSERSGEQPVCTATAEVACKNAVTGRPVRWPQELLRELKE